MKGKGCKELMSSSLATWVVCVFACTCTCITHCRAGLSWPREAIFVWVHSFFNSATFMQYGKYDYDKTNLKYLPAFTFSYK